jgi:hypothetical protein
MASGESRDLTNSSYKEKKEGSGCVCHPIQSSGPFVAHIPLLKKEESQLKKQASLSQTSSLLYLTNLFEFNISFD